MALKCVEFVLWTYWTTCAALVAMPVIAFVVGLSVAGWIDAVIEWFDKRFYGRDDDQAG